MKKTRVLSMLLCLALLFAPGAQALENSDDQALDLYGGMIGHIAFALPNAPQRLADADYEGLWTNSVQLAGYCVSDDELKSGGEFQFRTADISAWISGMTAANPDQSAYHIKANTLLQYAAFMVLQFGGELADMKASEKDEFVAVSFTYTYPDTPGAQYEGRAFLENGVAVCLIGEKCGELTRALERLRIVTDEEMRAYDAHEPETYAMGALSAVFPTPITAVQEDEATYAACFARDFSYLGIQYMPLGYDVLGVQEDALKDALMTVAQTKVLPAVNGQTVYDAVLSMPAPDMALLTFTTVNTVPYGEEYGQKFLCRLYMGARGVYYVYAADTTTGAAFMDSLALDQTSGT